ncbi:putative Copper transport protein ctr4 [Glarea lozoyensis 74030]|uniref:Copper transport protein n=1 Tax=Glarea lozoyensis (strain ATCC 74030 / MF5533) TaxID=1104152 RepID=H0EVC0_GLAL7|nr:putative Copper transport protein ctr4 [Glarea lozoyensis 74030]
MLHSRRSKFRRGLKGFGQYVRRPLGFFITLYATLITLFGLAWVLFLIGWVNVGGRQSYLINVIDNVLVALFAVMAHYHHLTWRLRREKALPKLEDHNDLPAIQPEEVEEHQELEEELEYSVLSPEQQRKLVHHQKKFAKSHSFYKPHETMTHHAFPLRLLVAIVMGWPHPRPSSITKSLPERDEPSMALLSVLVLAGATTASSMAMDMAATTAAMSGMVMPTTTDSMGATASSMPTMSMEGMGDGCKISMLWNWNTIDSCMFAGSCIGVILLVMSLEFFRRLSREYDALILRQSQKSHDSSSAIPPALVGFDDMTKFPDSSSAKRPSLTDADDNAKTPVQTITCAPVKFRPNLFQQMIRATLHMVQFTIAGDGKKEATYCCG